MGRKESNQTNKQTNKNVALFFIWVLNIYQSTGYEKG